MIVILKTCKYFSFIIILLLTFIIKGQNIPCYKKADSRKTEKKIPRSFCLPKEKIVRWIIDTVDLNSDNKIDTIIKWEKIVLEDGDTSFISILSSLDNKILTYSNLYTLNFVDDSYDYMPQNKELSDLKIRYTGGSNYNMVEFKKNTIIVGFYIDAVISKKLYFVYEGKHGDWFLRKEETWKANSSRRIEKTLNKSVIVENGIGIRNLNIINYLE